MEDFFKKFLYTGVGLVSMTAEKLQEAVDDLVGEGKMSKEEGKKIVDEFINNAEAKKDEFESKMKQAADDVASNLKFPTKKDLQSLLERIEAIEKKLGIEHTASEETDESPEAADSEKKEEE